MQSQDIIVSDPFTGHIVLYALGTMSEAVQAFACEVLVNGAVMVTFDKGWWKKSRVHQRNLRPWSQWLERRRVRAEKVKAWQAKDRKLKQENGITRLKGAQKRARKRGLEFTITSEAFCRIISQPCHYCGVAPPNGPDRVDNKRGYVDGNILPACGRCNMMKREMEYSVFLKHIQKMFRHLNTT